MPANCLFKDCGHPQYCKKFCKLHYSWLRKGWMDSLGVVNDTCNAEIKHDGHCRVCREPKIHAKGMCTKHYKQFKKKQIDADGRPLTDKRIGKVDYTGVVCHIPGCETGARKRNLCNRHYIKVYMHKVMRLDGSRILEGGRRVMCAEVPNAKCKVCSETKRLIKGFCKSHYSAFKLGRIKEDGTSTRQKQICKLCGTVKQFVANGYCRQHLMKIAAGVIDMAGNKIIKIKPPKPPKVIQPKAPPAPKLIVKCKVCPKATNRKDGIQLCRDHYLSFKRGYLTENGDTIKLSCKVCQERIRKRADGVELCHKHYLLYSKGFSDADGVKKSKKKICIVCQKPCRPSGDVIMCHAHAERFHNGYLDSAGNELQYACKVCNHGIKKRKDDVELCFLHYLRYQRGITDSNGAEINTSCTVCSKPVKFRDGVLLCGDHRKLYRAGVLAADGARLKHVKSVCVVCAKPCNLRNKGDVSLCKAHYRRYRNGTLCAAGVTIKVPPKVKFCSVCQNKSLPGISYCLFHYTARRQDSLLVTVGTEMPKCGIAGCKNAPGMSGLCARHKAMGGSGVLAW